MKPEQYGLARASGRKSRILKVAQEWKPIASPKLREVYSPGIEWATNLFPKLRIELEAPEEEERAHAKHARNA